MQQLVVGFVVAATALAGVGCVASGDGDSDAADETSRPPFAVYKLSDAVPATAGEDYKVEHRVAAADASDAVAILSDGDLLLVDGDWPYKLAILDPATGERENLNRTLNRGKFRVVIPGFTVLSDGELWLSWREITGPRKDPSNSHLEAVRYDPSTGDREEFTAPQVPQAKHPAPIDNLLPGTDGRLYFMTGKTFCGDGECGIASRTELWSFDPEEPDDIRREVASLAGFTIAGSVLTWIEKSGAYRQRQEGYNPVMYRDAILHTRDLDTGEEHSRTFEDCSPRSDGPPIVSSASLLVVSCDGFWRNHIVLDNQAEPLAELRLPSNGVLGVGDRWVVVGKTAYDTETGRLLRIVGRRQWGYEPAATAGDRILFPAGDSPRSVNRGTWAYAEMNGDGD